MIVGEAVDFLQEPVQRFRVAVRQEYALENIAEKLRNRGVLVHLLDAFRVEQEAFVAAHAFVEKLTPPVFAEFAHEERRLAAEFFGLAVHVVHELVDQGDGDLFHLRLRIRHFADQNIAGTVDLCLGGCVKHRLGP